MSIGPLQLKNGTRVDQFEVVACLGYGGQGQLYLVRPWRKRGLLRFWSRWWLRLQARRHWISPQQAMAKQLGVLKLAQPDGQANLLNEREYLAHKQAEHPHLVVLYGRRFPELQSAMPGFLGRVTQQDASGAVHSALYIVLAYEPGGSLADLLDRFPSRPLPLATAVALLAQVAEALAHLHETLGVVHHDVCPENIVLRSTAPPHAVLVDLAAAESLGLPRQVSVYGHERYLPPERLIDPPAMVSVAVDLYALGVLLHDVLGNPKLRYQRVEPHHKLSAANPAVPQEVDWLASHALDPDPQARLAAIPSAAAFAARLRAIAQDPALAGSTLRPARPRTSLIFAALLVGILVLMTVGIRVSAPIPAATLPPTITATLPTMSLPPMDRAIATPVPTSTHIPAIKARDGLTETEAEQ